MKKDQLQKLREKSGDELQKELQSSKDALWQLSVDLAAGKVKNVRETRQLKQKIAILLTVLKENKTQK
jgi:ribosomal protein L29